MLEILQAIVLTLEDVEVHGSANLSKLLGCINALKEILNQQKEGEEIKNG